MKKLLLFLYRNLKSLKVRFDAKKNISFCSCLHWQDVFEYGIKYDIFITNSIGGGTQVFTKNYCTHNSRTLVLRNISYGKDYIYILENITLSKKSPVWIEDIPGILNNRNINKIIINSLISNKHVFAFLEMIKASRIPAKVFVHDYYPVCPNYTLFVCGSHCKFKYCGEKQCMKNLNPFLIPKCSIYEWRLKWKDILLYAEEIRCFSNASKDIVLQAYPDIQDKKVTVVPHAMDYCHFTPVPYQKRPVHIGIVGAITSKEKGSDVVKEFLNFIKRKDCYVSVIGTPFRFLRVTGKRIHYAGQYNQVELQEIIQKENVNCIFFPSVCAETFSYLVSEIIMMNLPVVCFDFGAQAEKIRKYDKGIVCKSRNPNDIYESIKQALQL